MSQDTTHRPQYQYFVRLPYKCFSEWPSDVSDYPTFTLLLYLTGVILSNDDGFTSMSNIVLAEKWRSSESTIRRRIASLEHAGYLSTSTKRLGRGKGVLREIRLLRNILGVTGNDLLVNFHDVNTDGSRGKDPSRFDKHDDPMEG